MGRHAGRPVPRPLGAWSEEVTGWISFDAEIWARKAGYIHDVRYGPHGTLERRFKYRRDAERCAKRLSKRYDCVVVREVRA